METQIRYINHQKTIDVDSMHITGKKDSCSEYVMYQKIRRKYIVPIEANIKHYSSEVSKTKNFGDNKYHNKNRILNLFDYIMNHFSHYDLKALLSKEFTNLEFINKVHGIRYSYEKSTDSSV